MRFIAKSLGGDGMKRARAIVVGGASAAIIAGGFAAAPQPGELDTNDSADSSDEVTEAPDSGGTQGGGDSSSGGGNEGADAAVTGTFDGPVVSNIRGDYQVRLTFEDGVLVDVEFPVVGTEASESRRVNDQALPVLEEEFLEAQDWDVEHVTGASYTSPAMIESARGAFDGAGL